VVVEGRLGEDVEDAAGGPRLRVGGAEDDRGDAGEDDRPGAHHAGLERHVEGGAGQPPAAQRLGGGADREDLGVGGGIAAQLPLVAGGGERHAVAGDDRADRDVAVPLRLAGALDREAHEALVRGGGGRRRHRSGSMCD
jgi:hypothetical protein